MTHILLLLSIVIHLTAQLMFVINKDPLDTGLWQSYNNWAENVGAKFTAFYVVICRPATLGSWDALNGIASIAPTPVFTFCMPSQCRISVFETQPPMYNQRLSMVSYTSGTATNRMTNDICPIVL